MCNSVKDLSVGYIAKMLTFSNIRWMADLYDSLCFVSNRGNSLVSPFITNQNRMSKIHILYDYTCTSNN